MTTMPTEVLTNLTTLDLSTTLADQLYAVSRDRTHIISRARGSYTRRPATSYDGGATWNRGGSNVAGASLEGALETIDGEMLFFVGTSPRTVYKTTGWDPTTASWDSVALVLTAAGTGSSFRLAWTITPASVAPDWSPMAGTVFLMEYGSRLSETGDAATAGVHGYVSRDHGATWETSFDASDYFDVSEYIHGHGSFIDPVNNGVVVFGGDAGQASPDGSTWAYFCPTESLEDGDAWVQIPAAFDTTAGYKQLLCGLSTRAGLLFGSDSTPARVARSAMLGYRRFGDLAVVAPVTNTGALAFSMWQNPDSPDAPILLSSSYTSSASGYPSIIASLDGGFTWQTAYEHDTYVTSGNGITMVVGPDVNGKVYASLNVNGTGYLAAWDYVPPTDL